MSRSGPRGVFCQREGFSGDLWGTQWFPRPLSLKQHPPTPLALAGDQTDLYVLGWTNGIAIFFEHLWPTEVAIHMAQLTASVLLASRPGQPAGQTFSLCQSVSETFLCLCLCLSSLPPSLFLRFPSISSPSLSPLFRACTKGRGQRSGWGEQGRESAPPSPTTGGLNHPGEHKGSPLAWGVSGPSLFLFGQAFAGGAATSLGGR